jgi:hypothetical protein
MSHGTFSGEPETRCRDFVRLVKQPNRHNHFSLDSVELKASPDRYLPQVLRRLKSLDLLYAGAVEPNHWVLLHFQVMFLNVLIPQSDIAVVTAGIYHQADGTHLLQAIDITTSLTLADPQYSVYDAAEWVFDFRYDLTLVGD